MKNIRAAQLFALASLMTLAAAARAQDSQFIEFFDDSDLSGEDPQDFADYHSSGYRVKYEDQKIVIYKGRDELVIVDTDTESVEIKGDLKVTGDVLVDGDVIGDNKARKNSLNLHGHAASFGPTFSKIPQGEA